MIKSFISELFHTNSVKTLVALVCDYFFSGSVVWNALPDNIHVSPTQASLKSSLKPTCAPRHTHLSLNQPNVMTKFKTKI